MAREKVMAWVKYVLYLLLVVILADYIFFNLYVHKTCLKNIKLPQEKMSEFQSRLGWVQTNKKSSYSNFAEHKRSGMIRIGCFGDSFTYGSEVGDQYDYPSLLQDLFHEGGYDNIEVINFGTGGYGFHQTHMMWEWANRAYDLDIVLLNPVYILERDSIFRCRAIWNGVYFYMHSRYILKNAGEVARIDVVGDSPEQRVRNYFRFIPPFRYLRFDSLPPSFLSAPLECLFPGKQLKGNPFYYAKDLKKEMAAIYRILLSQIMGGSAQGILWTYNKEIFDLGQGQGKENFLMALLDSSPEKFPYQAFGGHKSPLGNRFLAQQIFDRLAGKKEGDQAVIEVKDIDERSMQGVQIEKIRLSAYKKIVLEVNNVPIGHFYDSSQAVSDYCKFPACIPVVDTFSRTASLFLLPNVKASLCDSVFLPLDFELSDDMPVVVRVRSRAREKDYFIGGVHLLNRGLNVGRADALFSYDRNIGIRKETFSLNNIELPGHGDLVTILIKNVLILSGKVKNSKGGYIQLESTNKNLFIIRADGREILDVDKLPEEGIIYLSLERGPQDSIKVPFAEWRKVNKKISLGNPGLHFIPSK